jgi:signal transduction histidine kinase
MNTQQQMAGRKAKILIVDDEAANVRGLMRLLEGEGYELCVGLVDAATAVAEFINIQPDLLLLDWHMEPMSGREVIHALREKFSETFLPPIIVLTADCCPETKQEALSEGASDFLAKPFDHSEVLLRIRNLLRLRRLVEQVESEKQRLEEIVFDRTSELRQKIDELKEVQQQVIEQDRMRSLAAMAGGVAHDFNNSLMVIRGFSELYGSSQTGEPTVAEMREAFDTIALAAHDAGEIVRRLRTFYQPFNSPVEERVGVSLNQLVRESVDLTRPKWETQTRAAGLCVSIQLDLEGDPTVFAAPSEIREVLINLLFNAVDAMPQGGQIIVRTRPAGGRILVEVEDTGTGMTEVTKRRCLEPFYTTKGDRGTGLGLAIIYGILHRHGGSIGIETELNHGTCMTLSLPVTAVNPMITEAPARTLHEKLRILMVDDDPLICSVVSRFLEGDEHRVTVAANGCDALEKFTSEEFDVVITDRVMPKMSGDQLAVAIRSIRPHAPIILLTGFETQRVPRQVDYLLSKPTTIESLRDALYAVRNVSHSEDDSLAVF